MIFDPFFGGVHIPIPIWTALFTELAAMMVYLECDFSVTFQCTYPTTCAQQLSSWSNFQFSFLTADQYPLTPDSYLLDRVDANGKPYCQVGVYGNRFSGEYILGDIFL